MQMSQESLNTFAFPDFASFMPVTDNTSFEGLSRDEIQAWALQKSEEYRLLSYTMLSLHNAAAHVHTLPVELLTKIFGQTWDPKDARRSLAVTSVCRRWRAMYLSTPAFWAEAVTPLWYIEDVDDKHKSCTIGSRCLYPPVRLSDGFVKILLDRSSPLPIAVYVEQKSRKTAEITLPACVLPSTVLPHLNHVVSLHVQTTLFHLHDLYRVLDDGMSTLEELDVWADDYPQGSPDLAVALASLRPVPDVRLPRLFDLRMDPAIFFSLIAVRSLKSVSLDAFHPGAPEPWLHPPGADSRSLLQLLSRCPNLEYLVLEAYSPTCWWPPLEGRGGTDTAIRLQSLKKFTLCRNTDEIWGPYALDVLDALDPHIPPTASVHFGSLLYDEPYLSLSMVIPSHLVQHYPFDTVILSPLSGNFREATWSIRCLAGQSVRFDTSFPADGTLGDLGIEDLFRTVHVTHLEIIPDPNQYRKPSAMDSVEDWDLAEDWAPILGAFPHLTHLAVSGDVTTSAVVDALGAVAEHGLTTNSDLLASGSPLCPALRYMTLGWEVPREICPKELVDSPCNAATYRQVQDVAPRVEQRCLALQLAFERRAYMKAQKLHSLEFYEYERQGRVYDLFRSTVEFGELIAASRRDDSNLPCLERLRAVVGGPVVYRGYLLKTVSDVLET